MTLSVHRVLIVEGEQVFVDVDHPLTMAGFEVCRRDVWGSEALIALGAQVLPKLRSDDVYAFDEELLLLERDVELLFDHLAAVAEATGYREDFIRHRAGNIRDAVIWAKANGGGVIIW
ncbi:MAG TPA: hypothetical protein VGE07_27900 [Herpetosiphonaceae bacterium]